MNVIPSLGGLEESKNSSVLAAPKSLAPINSKSKAKLTDLNLESVNTNIGKINNLESKLSNLPNAESEFDTEFESSKTNIPRGKVDEINALLGQERSMAELQTSINTRSPGPTNRSKLIQGVNSSSIMPADSNYAAHQSFRDEGSVLGGLGLSPDNKLPNERAESNSLRH